MGEYHVSGGTPLTGVVKISGCKNAVLPILAATVLVKGECIIHNCPRISDVFKELEILRVIGCSVSFENNTIVVNASDASNYSVPDSLVREMRSSIVFMGAMLGRFANVRIGFPGGCDLGPRPIGLHLSGLAKLGAEIFEEDGYIVGAADGSLNGAFVDLDFPSVGATENIMLAAVLANGRTVISNAAKEPEIIDLQKFLNCCGAVVSGAGSDTIFIDGVESLHPAEFVVMPDRIEAGTFLIAGAISGGDVCVESVVPQHLSSFISKVSFMGCAVSFGLNTIRLKSTKRLSPVDIRTMPYPGFPTDLQPQLMSLLTLAKGTSIIIETVFESRYKHIAELNRMGACIVQDGRTAIIKGVKSLHPASVVSHDLRGGAAMILTGLGTCGKTIVVDDGHILRGYDCIESKLKLLGADIVFIE